MSLFILSINLKLVQSRKWLPVVSLRDNLSRTLSLNSFAYIKSLDSTNLYIPKPVVVIDEMM